MDSTRLPDYYIAGGKPSKPYKIRQAGKLKSWQGQQAKAQLGQQAGWAGKF